MKVIWSLPAKYRLKEIYLFYKYDASVTIARKIIKKIFDATRPLNSHSKMGSSEELLKHKKEKYRYLVQGNYKIIYKTEKDTICIVDVFDCRQNPKNIFKNVR